MDITLVQPYYHNIWEALGPAYIAAYGKQRLPPDTTWSFFQGYFDSDAAIIAAGAASDIVGFSCTSPCFAPAVALARRIKAASPDTRCVFGGWHVSALGEKVFTAATEGLIDQIIIGEGEQAFLDIINGNKDRVVTGTRLPFADLPWPDRELIQNHRTVGLCEQMVGERIASFQANRGCPFSCAFCCERSVTGRFHRTENPVRSRDINDLCDEIEHVVKRYRLDKFKFVDATFDVSADYVISFCQAKLERGITTPWECLIHASLAEERIFGWLTKANCRQVNIGVETGSPKILKAVRKGTTLEKVKDVFRWARNAGIERRAFFLLGAPGETIDDIRLTQEFAAELEPDVFGVTLLCPYPGCDYYDHDSMQDIDWENTDEYSNDFWRNEQFSNTELKTHQARLLEKFGGRLCERQHGQGA